VLFSQLLKQAEVSAKRRDGDAEVQNVQVDSRLCGAGSCFVALRGTAQDGHSHIPAAVAAGCAAVVCEDASGVPDGLACAVVSDTHAAAGRLAQAIRGWPARRLTAIAVTGTNGKTTVAHLINSVLDDCGFKPAILGTIEYRTGARTVPSGTTTPGAVALAEMTTEMVETGRTHLVMEVSSHALDQGRAAGLSFQVAVFTNLSGDHLDYHGTMDNYLQAKRKLFECLAPQARAVINRDDTAGEDMAAASEAAVLWYGLNPAADLWARIDRIDSTGTQFTMLYGGREIPVTTPLIGRHNVYNCLAAAGACASVGVELPAVANMLAKASCIPGRLQRVNADAPYQVFVDYAHTDDALANVLGSLRPVAEGEIIVVFGCGGDRDRTKRPRMARVAQDMADCVVITSDNPRSEDPLAIIDEITSGLNESDRARCLVEPDRRKAIRLAIEKAMPGDMVLIAGKGHENYQVIGHERVHFDDVEEAEGAIRRCGGKS